MQKPPRLVRRVLTLTACVVVLSLLGACAKDSRLLNPSADHPLPALNWQAQSADGVKLNLKRVIVRNDEASWVKEADWDEYELSVRNDAAVPLQLRAIELSNDVLGRVPHSVVTDQLQSQTTRNVETMKTAGRVVVIGYTGLVTGLLVLASSAGYVVFAPVIPLALVVGGISAYRSQSQASADATVIEYEIQRRGFALPASLPSGAELQHSAFFPVTPAPEQLRLRYAIGGEERELVLPLPALAQLHIKQPDK